MIAWLKSKIKGDKTKGRVAVVRLQGTIAAASGRFSKSLNIDSLNPRLERAFRPKSYDAVVLVINSPGGSPVQSSLIGKRIRQLADTKAMPVYAVVEDVAASGGYWLACAADEIWADPGSLVGSIGVISASFGFDDFIQRHGIDRRVTTAGESKMRLDPFQPEKDSDKAWLKGLQQQIHAQFKQHVLSRRGARLGEDAETLMNGEVWLGSEAVKLGLIDQLGDTHELVRTRFGEKTKLCYLDQKRGGLASWMGMQYSDRGLLDQAFDAAQQRALWARFGL